MSSIDVELSRSFDIFLKNGGVLSTITGTPERYLLSSNYFRLLSIHLEGMTELQAKHYKQLVRDKVISFLDEAAERIMNAQYDTVASIERVTDRLSFLAESYRGGTALRLLDVVRTFTGNSLPFGQARSTSWLSDEIITVMADVFFVNKSWIMTGEGPVAPMMPLGLACNAVTDGDVLAPGVFARDVSVLMIKCNSLVGEAGGLLFVQKIRAVSEAYVDQGVWIYRPLCHLDSTNKSGLMLLVQRVKNSFQSVDMAEATFVEFMSLVGGSQAMLPVIKNMRVRTLGLLELESIYE